MHHQPSSALTHDALRRLQLGLTPERATMALLSMPSALLMCESCGNRQTFLLDDASVKEMQGGKTTPRHCLRCRTTTDWVFALLERRSGRERRQGGDSQE